MSIDKYRIGFHLFTREWSHSIHVNRWQKVIEIVYFHRFHLICLFYRATKEEMSSRAGAQPIPDGPPVAAAADKGFRFN